MIMRLKTHPRVRDPFCARIASFFGALSVVSATMVSGCVAQDDAEFGLSGVAPQYKCLESASPIEPASSFARLELDRTGLFFQTDGRQASAGDAIYLQIYEVAHVRAHLGEPFELADPRELEGGEHTFDTPPVARGMAYFAKSCPEIPESFGVIGTVIFHEFGDKKGAQMRGELRDAQVISLRDNTVVADALWGEWDFSINLNRPRQYFPNDPVQDSTGRLP